MGGLVELELTKKSGDKTEVVELKFSNKKANAIALLFLFIVCAISQYILFHTRLGLGVLLTFSVGFIINILLLDLYKIIGASPDHIAVVFYVLSVITYAIIFIISLVEVVSLLWLYNRELIKPFTFKAFLLVTFFCLPLLLLMLSDIYALFDKLT